MASLITKMVTTASGMVNSKETATHLTMFVIVGVVQFTFQKFTFKCPHENFYTYSIVLIIAPAVIIYCVCLLLISEEDQAGGEFASCFNKRLRKMPSKGKSGVLRDMLFKYIKCLAAPILWIVISLLQGHFYTCAIIGPEETYKTYGKNETYERVYDRLRVESQLIGILSFTALIIAAKIVIGFKKILKYDILDFTSLEKFTLYEAVHAQKYFEEKMHKRAEENAQEKVDMLLESVNADLSTTIGHDKYAKMSYEDMINARDRLIETYPILGHKKDNDVSRRAIRGFKMETEYFKNLVKNGSLQYYDLDSDSDQFLMTQHYGYTNYDKLKTNEKSYLISPKQFLTSSL